MEPLAFRVPEETHDALAAYADEHDVSLSEAAREHVRRGLEYEELRIENERLRNQKSTAVEKYQADRADELELYREHARLQVEYARAGWLQRARWRLFGRDEDDD